MKLCGKPTKGGKSCGYRIGEGTECPHHGSDPSRAKAFQMKGVLANQTRRTMPDLTIGDLATEDGIASTLQGLTETTAKDRDVDLKRVSEIRQALSVAVNLRQAAATRELNRTLMRLEHGEHAVILLEQLRANRTLRPLPPMAGRTMPEKEA